MNHTSNSKYIAFAKWFLGNKNLCVKNLITKEVRWVSVAESILEGNSHNLIIIARINCIKIK